MVHDTIYIYLYVKSDPNNFLHSSTYDVFFTILHQWISGCPKKIMFQYRHDQAIPRHPNFEPAGHPSWKTMENTEGCELPPHPVSADLVPP